MTSAIALQHENMVLNSPALGPAVEGKALNRRALTAFFKWFPDYEAEIQGHAFSKGLLTAWGRVRMTWTGDFLGVIPNGKRADLPVFMQFTFKDALIASELFFIDFADLCAQSGVTTDVARANIFSAQPQPS